MPSFTITNRKGQTFEVLFSEEDRELVESRSWFINIQPRTQYVCTHVKQPDGSFKQKKLHQLIMQPPKGMVVDHINHCGTDNRRENLRVCSKHENNMGRNKNAKGSSRYKGVTLHKQTNKWRAQFQVNKKRVGIGYFTSEEEAARAYDSKAKELFGEFAFLNFPEKI